MKNISFLLSFWFSFALYAQIDVALSGFVLENTYLKPGDYDLFIAFQNRSDFLLDNVKVHYSINDRLTIQTKDLSNLGMGFLDRQSINLSNFLNLSAIGPFELEVWLSEPNGQADPFQDNNSQYELINILETGVPRTVLMEEFSGAWCIWCPGAAIEVRKLKNKYADQLISLTYHANDPLEIPDFDSLRAGMTQLVSGFPSASFDRYQIDADNSFALSVETDDWNHYASTRISHLTSANIQASIDLDPNSRKLDVLSTTRFYSDDFGDFRINCLLSENSVTGVPQANAYNDEPRPYPELYQAGDPIIDYEHSDVVRKFLSPVFGVEGTIPASVLQGQFYQQSFSTNIPPDWDIEELNVVVFLTKHHPDNPGNNYIMNAKEYKLKNVSGNSENTNVDEVVRIFPNPVDDQLHLKTNLLALKVNLVNSLGVPVLRAIPSSLHTILSVAHLAPGSYYLKVHFKNKTHLKKLILIQ